MRVKEAAVNVLQAIMNAGGSLNSAATCIKAELRGCFPLTVVCTTDHDNGSIFSFCLVHERYCVLSASKYDWIKGYTLD